MQIALAKTANVHIKRRHCKNMVQSETVVLRIPELYKEKVQQLSGIMTPAACRGTISFAKNLKLESSHFLP